MPKLFVSFEVDLSQEFIDACFSYKGVSTFEELAEIIEKDTFEEFAKEWTNEEPRTELVRLDAVITDS